MTSSEQQPDPGRFPEALGPYPKAGDTMSFEELARGYNFQTTSDWIRLFVRLLLDQCSGLPEGGKVLDIGCGKGIARHPEWTLLVTERVGELHGVEPDKTIEPIPSAFAGFSHGLFEDVEFPEHAFDLAYSFMVVEHVANPDAFMRQLSHVLKPGGEHFFVTVNGNHHFAKLASFSKKTGLEDTLLRILRGEQKVGDYHYPVQYRMNRPDQIRALCAEHGFEEPEFAFVEVDGAKPYFPGPLRAVHAAFMQKRRMIKRPDRLLTMYVRMRKKGGEVRRG